MTTISAIKGKDFIVIGADSQVTAGNLKLPFPYQKIQLVGSNLIAGSGSVGNLQRLLSFALRQIRISKVSVDNLELNPSLNELCRELSEMNFMLPLEHKHFNPFSFLVGGLDEDGNPSLFSIGSDGSLINIPTFFADGSGSDFALSTLSKKYHPDINSQEAVNLVMDSLNQATKLDVYTNNFPQVFLLHIQDDKFEINEFSGKINEAPKD